MTHRLRLSIQNFSILFMNWFSFLLPVLSPLSSRHVFHDKLIHALSLSNISYQQLNYHHFNYQAEFNLIDSQGYSTKVILSTQKNPYWQVTALQQLQKIGRINGQKIALVNLSLKHPYATLQNN